MGKIGKLKAVGVLSAAVLIGAAIGAGSVNLTSAQSANASSSGFQASKSSDASQTAKQRIGLEQASKLALTEKKGRVESVELERFQGKLSYEVEIENEQGDYDIWIDAYTGKTLAVKQDDDDDGEERAWSQKYTPASGKSTAVISADDAAQIAAKKVEGQVIKVSTKWDDGRLVYEVKLAGSKGTTEVEINAKTGTVLEIDREDDDNDRYGDDDDRYDDDRYDDDDEDRYDDDDDN